MLSTVSQNNNNLFFKMHCYFENFEDILNERIRESWNPLMGL